MLKSLEYTSNQILLSIPYTVFVIYIPIIPIAFLGLSSLLETRHWIVQAVVASTTKLKARVTKDNNGRIVNINKYKYVYISYGYGLLGRSIIDTHTILRFGTITWMKYVTERRLHKDFELETGLNYMEVVLLNCLRLSCAWAVIDCGSVYLCVCLTVRRCR